jgi:hypothetical protein
MMNISSHEVAAANSYGREPIETGALLNSLPSPENSNPNPIFANQTLVEFLGEELGVREIHSAFKAFNSVPAWRSSHPFSSRLESDQLPLTP